MFKNMNFYFLFFLSAEFGFTNAANTDGTNDCKPDCNTLSDNINLVYDIYGISDFQWNKRMDSPLVMERFDQDEFDNG